MFKTAKEELEARVQTLEGQAQWHRDTAETAAATRAKAIESAVALECLAAEYRQIIVGI